MDILGNSVSNCLDYCIPVPSRVVAAVHVSLRGQVDL
jgi:hypothetical protein